MNTININRRSRYFSAGLALLGLTGILTGSFVTAAPAQADPPRHAPAYGRRDNDHKNDSRDNRKDDRRDRKDDKKNDWRDDRRDDHYDWSNGDKWNNHDDNRNDRNNRNSWDNRNNRYDSDRDGTPNRSDRYPTNPRRH